MALEDALAEEFCQLSLNAISSTEDGEPMKLRAVVKNKVMLTLVDSGSSHSFVSEQFLQKVGITPVPATPKLVRVANGEFMLSDKCVFQLDWLCSGVPLTTNMRVLNLGAYDAILGYDWLKMHSRMHCDWEKKILQFQEQDKWIRLHGVDESRGPVKALSANQLVKCYKGNDIWALVLLSSQETDEAAAVLPEVEALLHQYQDVFQDPKALPPHRTYDHTIPLMPGAVPVNSRPYRYSPQHKDEIERQVKEMLQTGLITPSTSPFASPVLLIQKKDGSWRFCVDYRRLNDLTIKNRFPMPIIEEILEELAGSVYFSKLDMRSGYHQVRMNEEDEHKTAFKTHHGHYNFKVMPFGLTNAPATFQCIMNEVLSPFLRSL